MVDSYTGTYLLIIGFGGLSLLAGLIIAGRTRLMGYRWRSPGVHAEAAEIEGASNLRLGVAFVIGGASLIGAGLLLATGQSSISGSGGGGAFAALTVAIVAVSLLLRSSYRLSQRASFVRVRDRMPPRRHLYLVWPPPSTNRDNSNPNLCAISFAHSLPGA